MYKIKFEGLEIPCEEGESIRDALFRAELTPHNGNARWFNCKGFGTCGTCAVRVDGPSNDKTGREKWRLDFPPHDKEAGLRLACQTKIHGDVVVTKYEGFWGQDVSEPRE